MNGKKKTILCLLLAACAALHPFRATAEELLLVSPEEEMPAFVATEEEVYAEAVPPEAQSPVGEEQPEDFSALDTAEQPEGSFMLAAAEQPEDSSTLAAAEQPETSPTPAVAETPEASPALGVTVSELRYASGSKLETSLKKHSITRKEMEKLALLLPKEVIVHFSDERTPLVLPVAGAWTPDIDHLRWTNRTDAAALPADVSDPNGLLGKLNIQLETTDNATYGSLRLEPVNPRVGASGMFRLNPFYPFPEDQAELWQVREADGAFSAVKRFDKNSPGFRVKSEQGGNWYEFPVDAWSGTDSGEWYAMYYRTGGTANVSYLVGPVSIQFGGSVVVYQSNGGMGTMADQYFAAGTQQALAPNAFTRDGYTFTGWNTAPDGSGTAYDGGATVYPTGNLQLYAQWAPLYEFSLLYIEGTETVINCCAPAGATLVCAVYDGKGKMLEAQFRTTVAGTQEYRFPRPAEAPRWSCFLLDETGVPRCVEKRA